jgi:uroporphyrinogen decarboxylase
MNHRQRVWAALQGDPVDRPPVSFWGHFYHRESSAEDLVVATLEHQLEYDWDWVKLNPRRQYHAEPWGARYRYSGKPNEKPVREAVPIHAPEDWAKITPRPPDEGALGEQLEAVRLLARRLDSKVPFIQTVFTPLAILGEMVGSPATLKSHIGSHPVLVRAALEAVTLTFESHVREVLRAGADGIYLATTDWASRDLMSSEEYREWARPCDERILAVAGSAKFNVLHVCKRRNLLFDFADYSVHAFSWAAHDRSNPSLREARSRLRGALMGGISHEDALQSPDSNRAVSEVRSGLEQTGGVHWLIAPGCSISPTTPPENLRAVRDEVENVRLVPEGSA